MLAEMTMKYMAEKRKFTQQLKDVLRNDLNLKEIEDAYTQLLKYMEENPSVLVLRKLVDINEFISQSVNKMDELAKIE